MVKIFVVALKNVFFMLTLQIAKILIINHLTRVNIKLC